MKKTLLLAVLAYFITKYVIEPSPVGSIVAGFLAPLGAMVSSLVGGLGIGNA